MAKFCVDEANDDSIKQKDDKQDVGKISEKQKDENAQTPLPEETLVMPSFCALSHCFLTI